MERLIYLDNSATTAPCNMAIEEAKSVMEQYFGNPSSLYEFGFFAEEKVSNALETAENYREYFEGILLICENNIGSIGRLPKIIETNEFNVNLK